MHRFLIVCLALAGCPSDDDAPVDSGVDATRLDAPSVDTAIDAGATGRLEIGTGLSEFIDVAEGGDVELVMGAQGGWHVDVAVKLYEMDPMDLQLRIAGFDAVTDEPATIRIERVLTTRRVIDAGDHFLRLGDQLVFTVEDGSLAANRDIRVEVEATPVGGNTARAEKVIHVVDRMP